MTRTQRLLELIQILRSHRFPVTAAYLANKLNVSTRTLYRDIAQLQQQGACIDSEPGIGYVLRSGFLLPPMMFSHEEIEALVLGVSWVTHNSDPMLQNAARNALAKISTILPEHLGQEITSQPLMIGPSAHTIVQQFLPEIRQAIRHRNKALLQYQDLRDNLSSRTIWPFLLGYFDQVRILVAWCELRQEFRHFRTDRISGFDILLQHYPRHRHRLLKEWKELEGIPHTKDY